MNYLDRQLATGMNCQQKRLPFHQEQHRRPSDHEKNPIFAVQAEQRMYINKIKNYLVDYGFGLQIVLCSSKP